MKIGISLFSRTKFCPTFDNYWMGSSAIAIRSDSFASTIAMVGKPAAVAKLSAKNKSLARKVTMYYKLESKMRKYKNILQLIKLEAI